MIMYAFLTGPLAGVSGYCHEACFENSEEILRKRFPPRRPVKLVALKLCAF